MQYLDFFSHLNAIRMTVFLCSIGLFIITLEQIRTLSFYRDNSILSWEVSRWINPNIGNTIWGKILNGILKYNSFKWIIYSRILLLTSLFFTPIHHILFSAVVFLLFVTLVLQIIRNPYGNDGAFQMYIIIYGTLSLSVFFDITSLMGKVLVGYISGQLLLSYLIAGVSKLKSQVWLNGQAIVGISGTKIYGNKFLYEIVKKNKTIAIIFCLTVISFELGFVIAFLFANIEIFIGFIIFGLFFHLGIAVLMGLNNFFFAFISTYPCLLYLYGQFYL